MTERTMVQAIHDALDVAMGADPRVVVLGEDVGRLGGVFRVTEGLQEKYGRERVIDMPLNESGIVGSALGMAMMGLRPVAEIQFADFVWPGIDQIVSEVSKYRYRTGAEWTAPLVIRMPVGGGIKGGHFHSQSPESIFVHTAGLTVVCPSNPYDAKGLLLAAIESPDPVIFLEPKRVYRAAKMDVPDGHVSVPLTQAKVVREGTHVTCVVWGAMLYEALTAAEQAAVSGVEVEVIDVRTLFPLDTRTLLASLEKTGRLVVVHEAPRTCGFGAELVAELTERAFLHLSAPPRRVTGFDTPFPYTLENEYLPLAHRLLPVFLETAKF